ncbi:MAG: polysaccharide deacetylase family protein [Minwuia sp.]|uniref:polysaccharide deacetylase family protein n=1 Tax=Minwuia sp. TaxID=2493630 RepID=UPI003A859D73
MPIRIAQTFLSVMLVVAALGLCSQLAAAEQPRRIIALHHPQDEILKLHDLHRLAEMPLNWLGYVLDYRELDDGFPEDAVDDPDVAGVITWFEQGSMEDPLGYLKWANRMADAGKKFVILGDFGFLAQSGGAPVTDVRLVNEFLNKMGVQLGGDWTDVTFDTDIVERNADFYDYERRMGGQLPPYELYRAVGDDTEVMLKVRNRTSGAESALMIVSSHGAFVEGGWVYYKDPVFFKTQWYVNPFAMFRRVFGEEVKPVPDITTLSGRRMYFSHIDGDGWRNVSLVQKYKKDQTYSARVVMEEAIKPYPDLPITVGPIVADLDPAWSGDEEAQQIAREIFALPQVEIAHHTYSHPFEWRFFNDYTPEKEAPFVPLYKNANISAWGADVVKTGAVRTVTLKQAYDQPRGFGTLPFDINLEFGPAADFVNRFAPPGKKVELVLWSGDTSPSEEMIRVSREAGLLNLNGGDSRFDPEFPSVSFVPPVGFTAGSQQQIYAANSNENTYTDLWSGRFFGFRDLVHTFRNTEMPRRLKPVNVYYHMYSGERTNALNGLLANLEYARSERLTPVKASRFARIGEGYFTTRFDQLGPMRWRVLNRGMLQTVRFDNADALSIDLAASEGVLGQNRHQGSLYVALDARTETPVIALTQAPTPAAPYLIDARWDLRDLERQGRTLTFRAEGFGDGQMRWGAMSRGNWEAVARRNGAELARTEAETDEQGVLNIVLAADAVEPLDVTLTLVDPE